MPPHTARVVAPVGALVLLLAACADTTTSPGAPAAAPSAQISADVAVAAGDDAARDVQEFVAAEASMGLGPSAGVAPATAPGVSLSLAASPRCPYDAASGRHVCPVETVEGLTRTRSFAHFDETGRSMERFDARLTAATNHRHTLDGTVNGSRGSTTWQKIVHHTRDYTVSGLLGDETTRTWNGTGTSADTTTHTGPEGTRRYAMAGSHTSTNVVFRLPRAEHRWPLSGTLQRTMSGTMSRSGAQQVTVNVQRNVRVTFDGDETARLEVIGAEGTVTCTLNLDTRQVSGCTG